MLDILFHITDAVKKIFIQCVLFNNFMTIQQITD